MITCMYVRASVYSKPFLFFTFFPPRGAALDGALGSQKSRLAKPKGDGDLRSPTRVINKQTKQI